VTGPAATGRALSYGMRAARRRARLLLLPGGTVAAGAFLLVLAVALMPAVRRQGEAFGNGSAIGRVVSGASIMAGGGWASMSMWIAGIVLFLIPAAMSVLELGGLWPSQGGVYVWAYRTLSERWAFLGGFLSWIPVILAGTLNPAAILAYLALAFNWQPSLTVNIVLQLVILWLCVGFAMRKLRLTKGIANGVFIFYMILVFAVFAAGLAFALDHGHAAVAFNGSDAFSFNFGTYGWIFGVALLYLVGVETPFNMGAEFVTARSSKKMILWGSVALSIGYVIATIGVLLSTPGDKNDPVTGVAKVFGFAGPAGCRASPPSASRWSSSSPSASTSPRTRGWSSSPAWNGTCPGCSPT
jgi:amino acid transporter